MRMPSTSTPCPAQEALDTSARRPRGAAEVVGVAQLDRPRSLCWKRPRRTSSSISSRSIRNE